MGGCISHLKKEMQPSLQYGAPREKRVSPEGQDERKQSQYSHQELRKLRATNHTTYHNENGQPLQRFETPSGVPGLTYDQAGRPVWREENASKADVEHRENR